jgi:hypothetical protein
VDEWRFNAFKLAEVTQGHPLSALGFWLMKRFDLIGTFQLDATKLARFLRKIEDGYPDNPYHNKTHAADVLQAGCRIGASRPRTLILTASSLCRHVRVWCRGTPSEARACALLSCAGHALPADARRAAPAPGRGRGHLRQLPGRHHARLRAQGPQQ